MSSSRQSRKREKQQTTNNKQNSSQPTSMMMHNIGRDASIPDLQRQRMRRVKKGECPECGTLLFKKSMLRKATPLTIKGKCWKGRCLVCFPLNSLEEEQAARKIPIPREIITCCTLPLDRTNNGDEQLNNSIGNFTFDQADDVSAITLDRRIRTQCQQVDQCGAAAASRADSCARGMTVLGLLATEEQQEPSDGGDETNEEDSDTCSSADCESLSSLRERMEKFLKSAEGSQRDIMQRWDTQYRRALRKQKTTTHEDKVLPEQAPPRPLPVQHELMENNANGSNQEDSNSSNEDIQIISDLLPESARPPRPNEVSPSKLHHKRVFQPHVFVPPTGKTKSNTIPNNNNNNNNISKTTTTTTTATANTTQSSSDTNSPKHHHHNNNNNNINNNDQHGMVDRVMLDETTIRRETAAYILEGSFREILFNANDDDDDDEEEDDDEPDGQADNNSSSSRSIQGPQKVPIKFNNSSNDNNNNSGGEEQSCTETGESLAALMEFSFTQNNESICYGPEDDDDDDYVAQQQQQQQQHQHQTEHPEATVDIPLDPFPVSLSQSHHKIQVSARAASDHSLPTDQMNNNIDSVHQPPMSPSSLSDSKPAASPTKSIATSTFQNRQQQQNHHPAPPSSAMMMMFDSSFSEIHDLQNHPSASTSLESLLDDLQNRESTARDHEFTLRQLAEYLWHNHHNGGRRAFVARQGVPVLTSILWMHMMTPSTATAAAEVLLALLSRSSPESNHAERGENGDGIDNNNRKDDLNGDNEDLLNREELEGVVDALLITMQTLIMDEGLQQAGCRVLCALVGRASSFDNNNNFNASSSSFDGTSAGAVLTVLNAMDAHATSPVVQEWGLRALCRQCSDSPRAEANQRTVLSSASQLNTTGATGGEVLERLLVQYDKTQAEHLKDGGILEWTCQLCWCLSAGRETVSEMVTLRIEALRELLHILEQCRSIPDASAHLQQAVLGVIANLSRVDRYRSFLGTSDVILLVLDTMHTNKQHMEVQVEACNVIANVSSTLSPVERDEIIDSGAVRTIVGAMFAFAQEKTTIQEPALRALVGLAIKSEIGKEDICEHDTLSVLMQLCRLDGRSTLLQQEMLCSLIASIYASDRLQSKAIKCDTFGALTAAMVSYSKSETIQSVCLMAYRNLSRSNLENLARGHEVCLAVNTMVTFRLNKSIQINACCVLWNMGAGTKSGHQIIAQTKAVECIVNAIQSHLDAPKVVEFACGALWGLIHQSQTLREQFFNVDGGVEALACILLMYNESETILEKACGVLAITASSSPQIFSVLIAADGVINMVQVLRSNPRSIAVLQNGAHFLRVAVQRDPNLADAASGALSVLIDALKNFTQADTLLREACYFIWAISGVSGDAKSKVIALEGESVLLWLLDQRSGTEIIKDAALGAFRELALVPSN